MGEQIPSRAELRQIGARVLKWLDGESAMLRVPEEDIRALADASQRRMGGQIVTASGPIEFVLADGAPDPIRGLETGDDYSACGAEFPL